MTASPEMRLIDPEGRRLYLTGEERAAFMAAARKAPREVRTFCAVLHDAGVRISEALELTPARIDLAAGAITIRSLKKRREDVYRIVPAPPDTLDDLGLVFGLREAQKRGKDHADERLWPRRRGSGLAWACLEERFPPGLASRGGLDVANLEEARRRERIGRYMKRRKAR